MSSLDHPVKGQAAPSVALAIGLMILLAAIPTSHVGPPNHGSPLPLRGAAFHPASMALSAGLAGAPAALAPSPVYDEQIGTTFTQDSNSLAYNVTAIAQADADGYGPGYLLNGLTPAGFWYQVGISYHWPDTTGTYFPGFGFNYQVYSSDQNPVYPTNGGAGELPFTGAVHSGDSVLLSLNFTASDVEMFAQDSSTGATARANFSNEGSTVFSGNSVRSVNSNGYFTGLMTEWYHSSSYFGNEEQVVYTSDVPLTSAWLWIDEFRSGSSSSLLFSNQTQSPVVFTNQNQLHAFSAGGATCYASAREFVSGMLANASSSKITLAPASLELSSPTFSAAYTLGGEPQTSAVQEGVTVLQADPGSSITLSIEPGSVTSGSWVFSGNSSTQVTFDAGVNASYVYYHVVEQTVSYQVAGGGAAPPAASAPVLTYQEPPAVASGTASPVTARQVLGSAPETIFALLGSLASINGTVLGAAGERWATGTQAFTISGADSIPYPIQLYHQYEVCVGYSIVGGGTPSQTPEFESTALGSPNAVQLLSSVRTTEWVDAGSGYSFTSVLNGSASYERWSDSAWFNPAQPAVSSPNVELSPQYAHQFYAVLAVNDASGGSISKASGWFDAGSALSATALANPQWQFEAWTGTGASAYTGDSPAVNVTVAGPFSENATFYAQLAVAADTGTDIAYSYGSQSGTVQAGTTKSIYVPPSSSVTLRATPSFIVYSFSSWRSQGIANETKPSLVVVVDSPSKVTGLSSYNYPVLSGAASIAAFVIIASLLSFRSRRRKQELGGAFTPPYS